MHAGMIISLYIAHMANGACIVQKQQRKMGQQCPYNTDHCQTIRNLPELKSLSRELDCMMSVVHCACHCHHLCLVITCTIVNVSSSIIWSTKFYYLEVVLRVVH